MMRARFRNSTERAELMVPGQIYKFTIDVWSTSNVFGKKHSLRLEISSSSFPRFDRNLNTGESTSISQHGILAANAIYHDADHPSALL